MKIKKAILTGGGRATRLRPITTTINKHLIPLANKPMIFHAIDKAVEAGVEEIFINLNPGDKTIPEYVGDGGHWGIKIKYFEQVGGPQGIAHVVKCAEEFIGNDPFMFYLSDNIIFNSIKPLFERFDAEGGDCMLAFAQVPDASRFGVPVFSPQGELIDVIEKPKNPPNNLAQTGIYLYGPGAFFEAFKHIEKSPRGEYEISDIHSYFLKNKYKVSWQEVTGWWKDTGKPEDLLLTNKMLLDQLPHDESCFRIDGDVHPDAALKGKVHCGLGSTVGKNVTIIGPVMLGQNCTLEDCVIGPHVTVGSGTTIKRAKVSESIIFSNAVIDAPVHVTESMIGEEAKIVEHTAKEKHRLILGDHTFVAL